MSEMDPMETVGDWAQVAPWKTRYVMLVLVTPGGAWEANSMAGKRELLDRADEGSLVVAWAGKWAVTARRVGPDDVEAVREALS